MIVCKEQNMRRTRVASIVAAVMLVFVCTVAAETGTIATGEEQSVTNAGCCVGRVGDANGSGGDEPTIGDAVEIALYIFGLGEAPACLDEADVNQSGGDTPTEGDITIHDAAILIDYLFITGPSLGLPDCL